MKSWKDLGTMNLSVTMNWPYDLEVVSPNNSLYLTFVGKASFMRTILPKIGHKSHIL